jgi:hypothetical protein
MSHLSEMRLWIVSIGLLCLFLQGCQQKKAPEENLYKEVMSVHDSVMPKMKQIREGIRYAEATLTEGELSDTEKTELEALKRSLVRAEDAMWEWMHAFDSERAQSDTAMAYLRDEQVKIKNVRALMLGSLEEIAAFRDKRKNRQ